LITEYDTIVWKYINGGAYYYFEWDNEVDDDKYYIDTIYALQSFPKQNDWKIYFDANKSKVATLVHFDKAKNIINTKHFNLKGKLIKELEAKYNDPLNYNPAFVDAKNVIFLKAYRNDSLIYEIQGSNTSILLKYRNPFTKKHFEKRVYYTDGQYYSEEIGQTIWKYYENGVIKSICNSHVEVKDDEQGNQYSVRISNCNHFDENGCLIKDQSKKSDTGK
jgi:hypothetical protein